jgi:hypothetical protein
VLHCHLNSLQAIRGNGNHFDIVDQGKHHPCIAAGFVHIVSDEYP